MVVLINQTHEDTTNEKAVRVPAVRAHDDVSEVLLDDAEIAAIPTEKDLVDSQSSAPTSARNEKHQSAENSDPSRHNSTELLGSGMNSARDRTLSPLQETPDSGRSN